MIEPDGHLCTFRTEPAERECLESCWSNGRACKTCSAECYRQGWPKTRVDADNQRRVAEKSRLKCYLIGSAQSGVTDHCMIGRRERRGENERA